MLTNRYNYISNIMYAVGFFLYSTMHIIMAACEGKRLLLKSDLSDFFLIIVLSVKLKCGL